MSGSSNQTAVPRAMIHKRILDTASDKPKASLEGIAAEVPSATTDLVERVLSEYGDPAEQQDDFSAEPEMDTAAKERSYPNPETLTEKQQETLRAIDNHPDATQRELAEVLGVSGATVCNRMNGVEEFDWESRQDFAKAVLNTELSTEETETMASDNNTEEKTDIDQLAERMTALEQRVEATSGVSEVETVFTDPELIHKVVHACVKYENITDEEELKILEELLQ